MIPLRSPSFAICAAMRWELAPVLRSLPGVRRLRGVQPTSWLASGLDEPILIFQTGVGVTRAAAAVRAVQEIFAIDTVINTGCAGSLSPALGVGAIVSGSRVVIEDGSSMRDYPTCPTLSNALVDAANLQNLRPVTDAILTSPVPLCTPEHKAVAFARFRAVAVEMEGAAIAEVLAESGARLACIRVILDDWSTALPSPLPASKTMFDFARKTARAIVSVQEVTRFSVALKNAAIVDRVLGNLFKSARRANVYKSRS